MSGALDLAPYISQNSLDSLPFYRVYDAALPAKRHGGYCRLEEASEWL